MHRPAHTAPTDHTSEPAPLGRTLIIANPAAQSGAGKQTAERLQRFLALYHHRADSFELVYTERPGHATELARNARGYDSVLALGGDGVVHEVANGLMARDAADRPALGVVPVGSGNDFARTLGLTDFSGSSFARCLTCERVPFDVGRVVYRNNSQAHDAARPEQRAVTRPEQRLQAEAGLNTATTYVVQTLSFGLDAAVALGTVDLRTRTNLTGAPLYLASGARVFLRDFQPYPVCARFDDGAPQQLRTYLLAIQLGPTYGSGFMVCPNADPTDGLFDVCYASGHANRANALALLLRAQRGHHLGSRYIHLTRAQHVELTFERADYPIQADGERLCATSMTVDILPGALTVLRPLWT